MYLFLALLDDAKKRWPHQDHFKMKLVQDVNTTENNIVHVAATQDFCIQAVIKVLEHAPKLLTSPNGRGETPIFPAVRYGQIKMFKFLKSN